MFYRWPLNTSTTKWGWFRKHLMLPLGSIHFIFRRTFIVGDIIWRVYNFMKFYIFYTFRYRHLYKRDECPSIESWPSCSEMKIILSLNSYLNTISTLQILTVDIYKQRYVKCSCTFSNTIKNYCINLCYFVLNDDDNLD